MTYDPLNKNGLFLSRELIIDIKLLESALLRLSGPICKKVIFIPYNFFSYVNHTDSDRSCDVVSIEIYRFLKNLGVPELYAKMYENLTKIRLYKTCHNFETKQKFRFKI